MNQSKTVSLLVSLGILSGCASAGRKVENKYDEVFKTNVCRVNLPRIANGYGQFADLTIQRENSGIKTTILTHDISSLLMKNKNFSNHPSITFNTFVKDQRVDHFELKSQTLDIKNWDEYPYGGGHVHHSNATALIPLTLEQLKKLSSAETATIKISDGKESLEGNVSFSEIDLLKQFRDECLGKAPQKMAS